MVTIDIATEIWYGLSRIADCYQYYALSERIADWSEPNRKIFCNARNYVDCSIRAFERMWILEFVKLFEPENKTSIINLCNKLKSTPKAELPCHTEESRKIAEELLNFIEKNSATVEIAKKWRDKVIAHTDKLTYNCEQRIQFRKENKIKSEVINPFLKNTYDRLYGILKLFSRNPIYAFTDNELLDIDNCYSLIPNIIEPQKQADSYRL